MLNATSDKMKISFGACISLCHGINQSSSGWVRREEQHPPVLAKEGR